MPSVTRCRLVLALVLAAVGSGAQSSAVDDPTDSPDATVRSLARPLCTTADSPAACLFKGLLKSALLYATRRHDAATTTAEKGTVEKGTAAEAPAGTVRPQSKGVEKYLAEQVQNLLGLFSFGFDLPAEITAPWSLLKSSFLDGRGKKNKNLGPMLAAGVAVMAGTLMPLAFGALFMMAGKAIMTSLLAITISGMLGLKELMSKNNQGHYKAYTTAALPPPAHYSEYEQEVVQGMYKSQTEAKAHSAAVNYYAGDSNLSAYYKGSAEQQVNGSDDQPEYYAGPKYHRHGDPADSNVVVASNNNLQVVAAANGKTGGNKMMADRTG